MRFRSAGLLFALFAAVPLDRATAAPVSEARESLLVFSAGPPGSGKNHTLHKLFTQRTPRVLSLDFTAEVAERNPKAITVYGLGATVDRLRRVTDAPWQIAAVIAPPEVPELFRLLAPPLRAEGQKLFGRALGGIAIECGELDLMAPNGRTSEEVAGAYRRCRHYGLSFYGATQRPASCDRLTTATAQALIATGTDETIDVKWWSDRLSPAVASIIEGLPRFHVVYYDKRQRRVFHLDKDYRTVAVYTVAGEPLNAG